MHYSINQAVDPSVMQSVIYWSTKRLCNRFTPRYTPRYTPRARPFPLPFLLPLPKPFPKPQKHHRNPACIPQKKSAQSDPMPAHDFAAERKRQPNVCFPPRSNQRTRDRWLPGLLPATEAGSEARLEHCPACQAWRTCFISADGTARCYACGAEDIEVDPRILRSLGASNASVTKSGVDPLPDLSPVSNDELASADEKAPGK